MTAKQRIYSWIAFIGIWRRRSRERRILAAMSGRLLQDIGVTPWDAHREANKPCWRA
jgi:uncharacterized protein YjiS (DUF1127 family)